MKNLRVIEKDCVKDLELKKRKYILSHDDETGELFVEIVDNLDDFTMSEEKDEVFGYWEDGYFVFQCFLDNENSKFSTKARFIIFKEHLQNSLLAIVQAERKLNFSDTDIYVKEIYKSKDEKFNIRLVEKTLRYYVYKDDRSYVEYRRGFDYKSLKNI